jgi:hypothetical protein
MTAAHASPAHEWRAEKPKAKSNAAISSKPGPRRDTMSRLVAAMTAATNETET